MPSQTIKAVFQPDPAVPSLVLTTLAYPTPKDNEYVIEMRAAAPCKDELGWEVADPHLFTEVRDRVPCIEGTGVVVSPPKASSPGGHLAPGTEVFFAQDAGVTGALRAFATAPASGVAPKPKSLSWSQAAAVPLSALTAWQGIFEHGGLDPLALTGSGDKRDGAREKNNRRVLVSGAAGAVGAWATRFAAAAGATVLGMARPARADQVKALGATTVLGYDEAASLPEKERVDLVFDVIGGEGMKQLWGAVKASGRFLEVGAGDPESVRPEGHTAQAKWFLVHTDREQLQAISKLIDSDDKLRPQIDEVFPFDRFADAFMKVDSGRTSGKVVITIE